jgi:DNA-binding NarL/FixJ family response regulator
MSPGATKLLISEVRKPDNKNQLLTNQEEKILKLIAEGLSNKDIAKKLYPSNSTIQFHVSNILNKLGVSKRTEAVYVALKSNFIEFPDLYY